ncbi:MAG: NAD(P)-dependent dehydrogenase (short-subunit alcohol dehydrogenase family) [Planctomycetota bacterium]|jgi:NAD(P)-dependent dehydrogenase (short-subunit alcohol dehydrogenase family)
MTKKRKENSMPSTLIVGASRGIGFEFTRQLVAAGRKVLATARHEDDLAKLKAIGAQPILLDVASEKSMVDFISRFDAPDLTTIIHNAGVFGPATGTEEAPSKEQFGFVMNSNVLCPMILIPQLGPMLTATRGHYVFLSSDMASIDGVNSSHGSLYRASKAALNMTVKCATLDFPMVTFTCLSPGWVRTDMGGEEAPFAVEESVRRMIAVIGQQAVKDSGKFVD